MTVQPIQTTPGRFDDEVTESHPAFGQVVVTRRSGGSGSLFQSDVLNQNSISLTVHTAERERGKTRDSVSARKQLIEIEMTLAQWGALVSSVGLGSGTPVTLRWLPGGQIPEIPFEPRIEASLRNVEAAADQLVAEIREKVDALGEIIESGAGKRALREAHNRLYHTVRNTTPNAKYVATELSRTAENIVQQAKVDIETQVIEAVRRVGLENVDAPRIALGEAGQ